MHALRDLAEAKPLVLQGQLQEAKAAQAAQPGGEENVQMQAEIERLKGDKVRMEEALTRERRNAAEMANSSKGGSELAVEIQQLRISLEKQSADLKTKESEMKEMAVQIKSLEVQLDNAKAQVDDACKNATLGSNESTQELRREIDKLEAENKYSTSPIPHSERDICSLCLRCPESVGCFMRD